MDRVMLGVALGVLVLGLGGGFCWLLSRGCYLRGLRYGLAAALRPRDPVYAREAARVVPEGYELTEIGFAKTELDACLNDELLGDAADLVRFLYVNHETPEPLLLDAMTVPQLLAYVAITNSPAGVEKYEQLAALHGLME